MHGTHAHTYGSLQQILVRPDTADDLKERLPPALQLQLLPAGRTGCVHSNAPGVKGKPLTLH